VLVVLAVVLGSMTTVLAAVEVVIMVLVVVVAIVFVAEVVLAVRKAKACARDTARQVVLVQGVHCGCAVVVTATQWERHAGGVRVVVEVLRGRRQKRRQRRRRRRRKISWSCSGRSEPCCYGEELRPPLYAEGLR
jgi:hypothetical protein